MAQIDRWGTLFCQKKVLPFRCPNMLLRVNVIFLDILSDVLPKMNFPPPDRFRSVRMISSLKYKKLKFIKKNRFKL